jgi:hypothetical protein
VTGRFEKNDLLDFSRFFLTPSHLPVTRFVVVLYSASKTIQPSEGKLEMNANKLPGFSAEKSLAASYSYQSRPREGEIANQVVPALPGLYCHYEKQMVVCGSALPGYPVPMCPAWVQVCTLHDPGPYSRFSE